MQGYVVLYLSEKIISYSKYYNNVLLNDQVSVSCGIPDFRSENGIYSRLSEFDLDDPQDMFDINYFRDCPEVFYSFAKVIVSYFWLFI